MEEEFGVSLEVSIDDLKLRYPTMLASGILGANAASLLMVSKHPVGALVTKSVTREPREGYPGPIIVEVDGGLLNAVGLSNPGVEEFKLEIEEFRKRMKQERPLIISVAGDSPEEFSYIVRELQSLCDGFELNLSCPHAEKRGLQIGQDPDLVLEVIRACRRNSSKLIIAKLSAMVRDIVEIAHAAREGGASAITLINTLGPGMVIDINLKRPVLGNKVGGLSGPAIKPIGVRCVYEVYENVSDIDIIGCGGIISPEDAIEYFLAGAKAVQIGSGVFYRGLDIFSDIVRGLEDYLRKNEFASIEEIVGLAHRC